MPVFCCVILRWDRKEREMLTLYYILADSGTNLGFPFSNTVAFSQVICLEVRFLSVLGCHVPSRGVSCVVVIIIIVLIPYPYLHPLLPASPALVFLLPVPGHLDLPLQGQPCSLWLLVYHFYGRGSSPSTLIRNSVTSCSWPHGLPGKGKMSHTAITHCPFAPSTKLCGVFQPPVGHPSPVPLHVT